MALFILFFPSSLPALHVLGDSLFVSTTPQPLQKVWFLIESLFSFEEKTVTYKMLTKLLQVYNYSHCFIPKVFRRSLVPPKYLLCCVYLFIYLF